jgi:hypothetical protein
MQRSRILLLRSVLVVALAACIAGCGHVTRIPAAGEIAALRASLDDKPAGDDEISEICPSGPRFSHRKRSYGVRYSYLR